MKNYILLFLLFCISKFSFSQYVYTIRADSVKITNNCDIAELIIENHTKNISGFFLNKGSGRTEFLKGLISTLDETLYAIWLDTLNLAKGLNALYASILPSDTSYPATSVSSDAMRIYPAFESRNLGGLLKTPTVNMKRLDISDGVPGATDNFWPLTYNNPYSRLVIDAYNYPLVIDHLPKSDVSGNVLIIDNRGKVWKGDSTSVLQNSPSTVKITTDVTSSSTSAAAISGLSMNVNAGTYYKFRFLVVFRSADSATGISLGLTIPASTVFSANAGVPIAADGTSGKYHGWITISGDAVIAPSVPAANVDHIAIVEGMILPSSSGTVQCVLHHLTEI